MDGKDDILRLIWSHLAVGDGVAFTLRDGREMKVNGAGEADTDAGIYFGADLVIDGVRRYGDVAFGTGLSSGKISVPSLQYVALHVTASPSDYLLSRDGERIPQLVLTIPQELERSVESLKRGASGCECGAWLGDIAPAKRISILDQLLLERLNRKCGDAMNVFEATGGDWAQTLYTMLFRAMGGNRNREPYMRLASLATYQMVLRERSSIELVEALLLGSAGLLERCYFDDYIRGLNDHHLYLSRKYGIMPMRPGEWERSNVRAQNKPITRIVQLASFMARKDFIFDSVISCQNRADVSSLFDTEVSGYWATHFVPDGSSERCPRRIGQEKADLLAINAVVPVMFAYGQCTGKEAIKERALELLAEIPAESNVIVHAWSGAGVPVTSALDSQALIQLKNEYCAGGRCAECRVGKSIIKIGGKGFCFR